MKGIPGCAARRSPPPCPFLGAAHVDRSMARTVVETATVLVRRHLPRPDPLSAAALDLLLRPLRGTRLLVHAGIWIAERLLRERPTKMVRGIHSTFSTRI